MTVDSREHDGTPPESTRDSKLVAAAATSFAAAWALVSYAPSLGEWLDAWRSPPGGWALWFFWIGTSTLILVAAIALWMLRRRRGGRKPDAELTLWASALALLALLVVGRTELVMVVNEVAVELIRAGLGLLSVWLLAFALSERRKGRSGAGVETALGVALLLVGLVAGSLVG